MSVLKVKVYGQRIRYEVAKVIFDDADLLKAKGWKWVNKGNSLCFCENRLDIIRDYDTFDCMDVGVAIRITGDISYEMGNTKGEISMDNVLSALNHPILTAIKEANNGDGLTLVSADVFDKKNTIYEYTVEVGDREAFDGSLLEIISIRCPIDDEEHIVEVRYKGQKMEGGPDGRLFRDPVGDKVMYMLTVPKDYADALGLGENRKQDNILRFADFINENWQDGKKPINKVKSVKEYVKIREDYIHSFIEQHEPDQEPEEE